MAVQTKAKRTAGFSLLAAAAVAAVLSGTAGPLSAAAQDPARTRALTLRECLNQALKANLDISIETLNSEIAEASLRETREKFLPQFGLNYQYRKVTQLGTWGVEGAETRMTYDYALIGISQRLALGTEIQLGVLNSMMDTSRAYTIINPAYNSELRLDIVQPLLKGFGSTANRISEIQAEGQKAAADSVLDAAALTALYSVEEAYWNLYHARENLRVQDLALEQSRDMLKRAREAERIGAKSAIEVLGAETQTANWEDGVLSARLTVELRENQLKKLLRMPAEETGGPASGAGAKDRARVEIIPSDKPAAETRSIGYEEALRTALARRPEIGRAERQLETSAANIGYYRNQLLPQLDLNLSLWSPGQSGIRYLFQDDNPLSNIIIGQIVGGRADSFKEALKGKYRNWSLNLTLTLPVASFISRAALAKAKLERDQLGLQLEKQRQAVAFEVLEAVKDLRTSLDRIASSARYRELMEKKVGAELQRYQLGLVGSEWLLSYQRDLATAKVNEIRAVVDHKIAVAKLDRAMGVTLEARGLKIAGR